MVLINFTEAEQDQRIQLPSSILAKPPEAPLEDPITLQLMKNGEVVVFGDTIPLDSLPSYLIREGEALELADKKRQDATIIIRADAEAATGQVQEMIKILSGCEVRAIRTSSQGSGGLLIENGLRRPEPNMILSGN